MPHFTDDEVKILNEWSRTQPALRKAFPYTSSSDDGRGLGTLLNQHDGDLERFYILFNIFSYMSVGHFNFSSNTFAIILN